MRSEPGPIRLEHQLEKYREYLRLIARLKLDQRLQGKIDLSGVIQQTLMEAHQAHQKPDLEDAGQSEPWLRRILTNNLADEIRKLRTGKRDLDREQSLDAALEQSSRLIQHWLAAEQASPSSYASLKEQALELSAALYELPEAQREALIQRHFQDRSLAQIAQHLGRSHAAVAGLLKRGLQQLRNKLQDWE